MKKRRGRARGRDTGAALTAFERAVYAATARIPRGRVATYAGIARAIGAPRAWRAVGNALHKNPFPSSRVPCHRVVQSNGRLGGFAGGARAKAGLLAREGVRVRAGRVQDFPAFVIGFREKKNKTRPKRSL